MCTATAMSRLLITMRRRSSMSTRSTFLTFFVLVMKLVVISYQLQVCSCSFGEQTSTRTIKNIHRTLFGGSTGSLTVTNQSSDRSSSDYCIVSFVHYHRHHQIRRNGRIGNAPIVGDQSYYVKSRQQSKNRRYYNPSQRIIALQGLPNRYYSYQPDQKRHSTGTRNTIYKVMKGLNAFPKQQRLSQIASRSRSSSSLFVSKNQNNCKDKVPYWSSTNVFHTALGFLLVVSVVPLSFLVSSPATAAAADFISNNGSSVVSIPILFLVATLTLFVVFRIIAKQLIEVVSQPSSSSTSQQLQDSSDPNIKVRSNSICDDGEEEKDDDRTFTSQLQIDLTTLIFSFITVYLFLPDQAQLFPSSTTTLDMIDKNDSYWTNIFIIFAVCSSTLLWFSQSIVRPLIQQEEEDTHQQQSIVSLLFSFTMKEIPLLQEWDIQFQSFLNGNNNQTRPNK